jgi:hypothetical protein
MSWYIALCLAVIMLAAGAGLAFIVMAIPLIRESKDKGTTALPVRKNDDADIIKSMADAAEQIHGAYIKKL